MYKAIIIIISTMIFVAVGYVGIILAILAASTEIVFKPLDIVITKTQYIYEDYLTAPFDNPEQFKYGWQGEENPVQVQK